MKNLKPIGDAAKKCFQAGKKFYDECTEAENIVAASRAAAYQEQHRQELWAYCRADYNSFGNIVGLCLSSNYRDCGLSCPKRVENVYSPDRDMRVRQNRNGTFTFRYEVKRLSSDMFVGGMQRLTDPDVPTSVITDILNQELPIFAECENYCFNRVAVEDIPGNRVAIKIYGVDWMMF